MSEANATQVGGTHYQSSYQHWDLVAKYLGSGYFKGVVTKYVTRWRKKNGKEDLEKARHYLVKLIELNEKGVMGPLAGGMTTTSLESYVDANALTVYESNIIDAVFTASSVADLETALLLLDELIAMN